MSIDKLYCTHYRGRGDLIYTSINKQISTITFGRRLNTRRHGPLGNPWIGTSTYPIVATKSVYVMKVYRGQMLTNN